LARQRATAQRQSRQQTWRVALTFAGLCVDVAQAVAGRAGWLVAWRAPPPPFVQSAQHHLAARGRGGAADSLTQCVSCNRASPLAHAAKGDARRGDVLDHGAGRAVCAPGMSSIGTARATHLRRRRCPCRCRRLGCRRRSLPSHGLTMKVPSGHLQPAPTPIHQHEQAMRSNQLQSMNDASQAPSKPAGGAATDYCRCRHSGCWGRCHCLHWYCCM
jgi:hypothetical protein